LSQHTYEEIRDVVMDILLKRVTVRLSYEPNQWVGLKTCVAEVLASREIKPGQQFPTYPT
jgi:hypothetical protein